MATKRNKVIQARDRVARAAGYRPTPVPESQPWTADSLADAASEAAHQAEMKLRGLRDAA